MSVQATVYRVLIASPSDVLSERKAITEVLYAWNALNSVAMNIVLLPVMWETHSAPEMGGRPQEIINKQLVRDCDFLIGTFWTRIGTHTGVAVSGTVEEIREFLKAGKPVMLYFSTAPVVPDSIDPIQYKQLVDFRNDCKSKGLIEWYESVGDFREKLSRHITIRIREIHGSYNNEASEGTETETKPDIDVSVMLIEQFRNLIKQFRVDWDTEKNSEPINIEDGKLIIHNLTRNLIEYRATFAGKLDTTTIDKIDDVITKSKILNRHELYLDGGTSYKEFWEKGNELFLALETICDSTASIALSKENSKLDSDINNILVVLAKYEEQGGKYLPAAELAQALGISVVRVQHYLDELVNMEHIHDMLTIGMPTKYMLDTKGRKYLVDNGLV